MPMSKLIAPLQRKLKWRYVIVNLVFIGTIGVAFARDANRPTRYQQFKNLALIVNISLIPYWIIAFKYIFVKYNVYGVI